MKLKALALSVGVVAASSASAAVLDFGNVGATPSGTYFAQGFIEHLPGSFEDFLMFSLSSATYDLWSGLGTVADQPKVDGSNIEVLTASLYLDLGAAGASPEDTLYAFIGSGDYISGGGPLAEGAYYFKVEGAASGPSASAYAYTATVSAVPEPTGYAMLFAGLGLISVVALRRTGRMR